MGQVKFSEQDMKDLKDLLLINEFYAIEEKRCLGLVDSKYWKNIEFLIQQHIIKTLNARECDSNQKYNSMMNIKFYFLTYNEKEYPVSLEKIISSLHFVKIELENGKIELKDIEKKFDEQIFFKNKVKTSHKEIFEMMKRNFSNLRAQFGQSSQFITIMEKYLPHISYFVKTGGFPPGAEWLVLNFNNKFNKNINNSFLVMEELKLAHNFLRSKSIKDGCMEILRYYTQVFEYTNSDPLHFSNFIAFTWQRLKYINELMANGKGCTEVIKLVWKEPVKMSWSDCVKGVIGLGIEVEKFNPTFIDSSDGSQSIGCGNPNFVAKPDCFQNPLDLQKNEEYIVKNSIYSQELENGREDAQKILEQKAKNALKKPKEYVILQPDAIHIKYIHYDTGIVVEFFKENEVKYLKRIFKINKDDFLTWSAIKYLFSKEKCVEIFKQFIDSYKKYSQPDGIQTTRSARYFFKHSKGGNPSCLTKPNSCDCQLIRGLSETDFRKVILRFLEDRPFMKSASTAALHLLEHGGKSDEEKQQIHKGENLDKHFEAYFMTATGLLEIIEQKAKDVLDWVNMHKTSFTYNFSHTGALTINYGKWDGRSQGTFAYITILGDGSIFLKSLFTGYPKDLGQAKCFGLEKEWELYEQNK